MTGAGGGLVVVVDGWVVRQVVDVTLGGDGGGGRTCLHV